MWMRAVSYISCKLCGKKVDVHFAHGAIEVYPCKKCCSIRAIVKRTVTKFFKNKPPRGT
jgi:ribosome-binding protein aMBF1 (putative translation factor)